MESSALTATLTTKSIVIVRKVNLNLTVLKGNIKIKLLKNAWHALQKQLTTPISANASLPPKSRFNVLVEHTTIKFQRNVYPVLWDLLTTLKLASVDEVSEFFDLINLNLLISILFHKI